MKGDILWIAEGTKLMKVEQYEVYYSGTPFISESPGTWMCSQLWVFHVFKLSIMYMHLCNFCNDIEANNLPSVYTMLYCTSEAEVFPVQQMVPNVCAT